MSIMIEESINKLKKSPLFNLSLSSMELFHSNFLYWFGHNYPDLFKEILPDFIKGKLKDTCIKGIFREREKIDLSVDYSDGQVIIIENKITSIPYYNQLKKYSDKHKNDRQYRYILLSLSSPVFFDSKSTLKIDEQSKLEADKPIWHYLSYDQLRKSLQNAAPKITESYHKKIIEDYQEFIGCLVEINEYCNRDEPIFNFHSTNHSTIYKSLEKVRLHHFYLKRKYENIAYIIYQRIKSTSKGKLLTEFNQLFNWTDENPRIFVGHGMTRGLGLIDLKYLISPNMALGIQIQGEHYRMVLEGSAASKNKEILDDSKLWFNFSESFPDKKIYPTTKTKRFNKYEPSFFYKSVKLGVDRKTDDVLKIILKDIDKIEQNIDVIKEIP